MQRRLRGVRNTDVPTPTPEGQRPSLLYTWGGAEENWCVLLVFLMQMMLISTQTAIDSGLRFLTQQHSCASPNCSTLYCETFVAALNVWQRFDLMNFYVVIASMQGTETTAALAIVVCAVI